VNVMSVFRILILSGLAVALTAGSAAADTATRKRKKNLFESLFSSSSSMSRAERNRRDRAMFGRKWWEDRNDGIRIISGQDEKPRRNRNVIVASDEDPEGDPGFGMGNLPYAPDKTLPLDGQKFASGRPADATAGLIYDALTGTGSSVRVRADIRETIAIRYLAQNFRPIWLENGKLSQRGDAVLKVLAAADEDGLEAARYLPPSLGAFTASAPEFDPAAMARLDIEITAATLRYARDASGGQFDPRRLSLYHDVTPAWVAPDKAIKVLAFSPYPADYLKSLHPAHPAYAAMKAALAELRKSKAEASAAAGTETGDVIVGAPAMIAEGPIVKVGKSDGRIPAVRKRLADLGYPDAVNAAGEDDILDADLSVQLRLFQKASGIKVSGLLGPQTVGALNADHTARDEARLLDNIERLRWLPKDLGQRHVFVNQAAFEVRVMDKGSEVWKSRVIVGKPLTQTSVFYDEMETVVFNPSWGVPPSIIANEYLPKLRNDPSYLDRIGFKVVDASGKVVRSSNIDWWNYGSKVPFGIQQPPGDDNALGELKFLFPNTHNIYMHDTPTRNLFEKDVRAFSHGCVRVQNPREFAQVILGWDAGKVDANVDSKKSQTVKLPQKVPVYLTYFTAWPDETGKIVYYNDIYGRDKTLETARNAVVLAQR
jgi:murein L,D-transpeptidase YcbB/YkuD